jgi:hypothetical protein
VKSQGCARCMSTPCGHRVSARARGMARPGQCARGPKDRAGGWCRADGLMVWDLMYRTCRLYFLGMRPLGPPRRNAPAPVRTTPAADRPAML